VKKQVKVQLRKRSVFSSPIARIIANAPITENTLTKEKYKPVWVAQACNPSYSVDRDQEDCSSKPPQQIQNRPYLENTQHTKGLAEWFKW
jgi:hypothetical protein